MFGELSTVIIKTFGIRELVLIITLCQLITNFLVIKSEVTEYVEESAGPSGMKSKVEHENSLFGLHTSYYNISISTVLSLYKSPLQ